jgi:hypothetical protein
LFPAGEPGAAHEYAPAPKLGGDGEGVGF